MSSTNLQSLPIEILCLVFEAADSLHTAIALAQTASKFQEIWTSSNRSICLKVLPRSLECYEDAQELAIAQSKVVLHREQITTPNDSEWRQMQHIKRLLGNARNIKIACDKFAKGLSALRARKLNYYGNPNVSSAERTRFIQDYYRMWKSDLDLRAMAHS
ncbi:hypothetical protein MMC28_004119 [Mycoblastus sanguinarius]|nr:hypothetical protein [Mycoblastus sanguinarius]